MSADTGRNGIRDGRMSSHCGEEARVTPIVVIATNAQTCSIVMAHLRSLPSSMAP